VCARVRCVCVCVCVCASEGVSVSEKTCGRCRSLCAEAGLARMGVQCREVA